MNEILEIINDLKIVNKSLEDEETPIHPQTIFAKHKTRELIAKYENMVSEYESANAPDISNWKTLDNFFQSGGE